MTQIPIALTFEELSFFKDLMLNSLDSFYVINGDNPLEHSAMRNRYNFLYGLKNKVILSWDVAFNEVYSSKPDEVQDS